MRIDQYSRSNLAAKISIHAIGKPPLLKTPGF